MSRTYRHRHSSGHLGSARKFVDSSVRSYQRLFKQRLDSILIKDVPPRDCGHLKFKRYSPYCWCDPAYRFYYEMLRSLEKENISDVDSSYNAPNVRWYKVNTSTVFYKKLYNRKNRRESVRLSKEWAREGDDFKKTFPPLYDFEWDLC